MFTVNSILFNHKSAQRGETFITRNSTGAVEHNAAGQLADSVNVWGDISNAGRFLIPKGLNTDLFNISKVKIKVSISCYLGPYAEKSIVKNFEFKYKEPIPAQLYQFNLQNNDVVSIEVRRRPNFWITLK